MLPLIGGSAIGLSAPGAYGQSHGREWIHKARNRGESLSTSSLTRVRALAAVSHRNDLPKAGWTLADKYLSKGSDRSLRDGNLKIGQMQAFWEWRAKFAKMSSPLIVDVAVAIAVSAIVTNIARLMFS